MNAEQQLAEIRRKTSERNRRYYEANKERINRKKMERYRNDEAVRERHKEACKRYYAKRKELVEENDEESN
jgi:hypothetical protein